MRARERQGVRTAKNMRSTIVSMKNDSVATDHMLQSEAAQLMKRVDPVRVTSIFCRKFIAATCGAQMALSERRQACAISSSIGPKRSGSCRECSWQRGESCVPEMRLLTRSCRRAPALAAPHRIRSATAGVRSKRTATLKEGRLAKFWRDEVWASSCCEQLGLQDQAKHEVKPLGSHSGWW